VSASIFLDFNLPNAATWFYFALILVVAFFFRFNRLLSVRNWDILTLFLLVPGFLLLQEAYALRSGVVKPGLPTAEVIASIDRSDDLQFYGYLWLMIGSGYFLLRCLLDLALERRPVLTTNLNFSGMAWMVIALLLCLTAVAVRRGPDFAEQIGKGPIVLEQVQQGATTVVSSQTWTTERATVRFWVTRGVAMASHISIVIALVMIGWKQFGDATVGMGAAVLYLLLPYTALHVAQVHHVLPTCLLLWAIFSYRRPVLSGWFLGVAAGSAFFPLLLFPLWCGFYWKRGACRFIKSFLTAAGLCLALTVGVLWLEGQFSRNLRVALNLADWQPWRIPTEVSIWTGVHWAYRMPVFIGFLALMIVTSIWPSPKNLGQVIALSAAILIGVQFWYADQGGVYALWYMPLLVLVVFRPNLIDSTPPLRDGTERAWFDRWGRKLRRRGRNGTISTSVPPESAEPTRTDVGKSGYSAPEERVRFTTRG